MAGGRARQQMINVDNSNNRRIINFNYSENFNRVVELNTENYTRRRDNMLRLLSINDLISYITTERVKELRKKDIKGSLDDYIQDQFDDFLLYEKGTSEVDINNDITTKWMIINSLCNESNDAF